MKGAGCTAIALKAHLDFPQYDDTLSELVRPHCNRVMIMIDFFHL